MSFLNPEPQEFFGQHPNGTSSSLCFHDSLPCFLLGSDKRLRFTHTCGRVVHLSIVERVIVRSLLSMSGATSRAKEQSFFMRSLLSESRAVAASFAAVALRFVGPGRIPQDLLPQEI